MMIRQESICTICVASRSARDDDNIRNEVKRLFLRLCKFLFDTAPISCCSSSSLTGFATTSQSLDHNRGYTSRTHLLLCLFVNPFVETSPVACDLVNVKLHACDCEDRVGSFSECT